MLVPGVRCVLQHSRLPLPGSPTCATGVVKGCAMVGQVGRYHQQCRPAMVVRVCLATCYWIGHGGWAVLFPQRGLLTIMHPTARGRHCPTLRLDEQCCSALRVRLFHELPSAAQMHAGCVSHTIDCSTGVLPLSLLLVIVLPCAPFHACL